MELMRLDSDFGGGRLVETYESLIWTERYSQNGDFQLTASDISGTLAALPLESFVTLRESTVPMVVEYHKIEKKKDSTPQITVSGRTFECSALERRASVRDTFSSSLGRKAWTIQAAKESDAAYETIRSVIGDDQARYQDSKLILNPVTPRVSLLDAIAEIDLTLPADFRTVSWNNSSTYVEGEVVLSGTSLYVATALDSNTNKIPASNPTYWTNLGSATGLTVAAPAWSATPTYVQGMIVRSGSVLYSATALAGNTNKDPASSPTYWTIIPGVFPPDDVKEVPTPYDIKAGNLYGTILELLNANNRGIKSVRPLYGSGTKVGVEIYNGSNLTEEYVLDARFDQIDDATYLFSYQGSANVAYVYGNAGSELVKKTAAPEPSGLSRRVLLVDDNTIAAGSRYNRGLVELYNNNVTNLFGGEVANQVALDFNKRYFLGDILKLQGEYAETYQNVRVTEFIRSSDSNGEKSYPTFEAVI